MKLPRQRGRRTLQQRLMGTSCLLILFPLLITSSLLFWLSCHTALRNTGDSLASMAEQAGRLLHTELNAADSNASTVAENLEIQNIQARCRKEEYSVKDQLNDLEYAEELFSMLKQHPSILQMRMTAPSGLIYSHSAMVLPLSQVPAPTQPFTFARGTVSSPVFGQADIPVISCIKPIRSIEQYPDTLGYAMADLPLSRFRNILTGLFSPGEESCVILDSTGQAVASVGTEEEVSLLLENCREESALFGEGEAVMKKGCLLAGYRDPVYGWSVCGMRPMNALIEKYISYFFAIFGLLLILSGLTLFLGNHMYRSLTVRIEQIVSHLHQVESGDLDGRLTVCRQDEIGQIEESYNYMVSRLKALLEEQKDLTERINASEMDALMARIDPHFLYNTLNTLSWTALDYQAHNISKMLMTLSQYYKLCLQNRQPMFSVSEELQHAELYVEIHNMRYPDSVRFTWEVPPELTERRIPNMVLQPLIENSILHGILEKPERTGWVKLKARSTEGGLEFTIQDNGTGMGPEKLRELAGSSGDSGGSYGVSNIRERLRLKYGEAFRLEYSSRPGEGTTVTLWIPEEEKPL